jgi:hypothetical protein
VDSIPREDYAHRRNADGTFDSICLFCFRTIASAEDESELAMNEKRHSCQPKVAYRKMQNPHHKKD